MVLSSSNWLILILLIGIVQPNERDVFFSTPFSVSKSFNHFPEHDRLKMIKKVKDMFYFGYDNYMKYAFPLDELNPIFCSGRGPDKEHP